MDPRHDEPAAEWLELTVHAPESTHEAVGAFLFEEGCTGLVQAPAGPSSLKAYLPAASEDIGWRLGAFAADLAAVFPEAASIRWEISRLRDQGWTRQWRRFFRPLRVSPRLLVLPAWYPPPAEKVAHVIRIDPGPAFGTGQHPTTQMCLRALEATAPEERPWDMLDVGTGSGILAIYAALRNARRVVAVDIDRQALAWAARNLEINRVSERISLSAEPVERISGRFDILTANLDEPTIGRLLACLIRLLRPRGRLVLSGILAERAHMFGRLLHEHSLAAAGTEQGEEWLCITAEKVS